MGWNFLANAASQGSQNQEQLKKWNNLHLNEAQKALTFNALARKAKARSHEKMGNLTFRNLHNSLIINNVHRIPAFRLSEN